jgi:hypothetical protein
MNRHKCQDITKISLQVPDLHCALATIFEEPELTARGIALLVIRNVVYVLRRFESINLDRLVVLRVWIQFFLRDRKSRNLATLRGDKFFRSSEGLFAVRLCSACFEGQ